VANLISAELIDETEEEEEEEMNKQKK